MTRDLDDLLRAAAAEIAARAPAPEADARARLVAATRRRRGRRQGLRSTLAVLVVGAVTATTWWAGTRLTTAPLPAVPAPILPDPTVTAPSTPSPAPSVATDGLPAGTRLLPGVLEASTPGWTLTAYRPVRDGAATGHALYLVDPDGRSSRLTDLPVDTGVELLHWEAGQPLALVATGRPLPDGTVDRSTVGWLDVTTGDLTPVEPPPTPGTDAQALVGYAADGLVWMSADGYVLTGPAGGEAEDLGLAPGTARISPDGTRLAGYAFSGVEPRDDGSGRDAPVGDGRGAVVDLATGTRTDLPPLPAGLTCTRALGWTPDARLRLVCTGSGTTPDGLYDVGPDHAATLAARTDDLGGQVVDGGGVLPDGRSVLGLVRADERCVVTPVVLDPTTAPQPLDLVLPSVAPARAEPTVTAVDVGPDGTLYLETTSTPTPATETDDVTRPPLAGCPRGPAELVVHDLRDRSTTLVAPLPGLRSDQARDDDAWRSGLESWAAGS